MNSPIIGVPEGAAVEQIRVDDTRELVKPRRSNRSARAAGSLAETKVAKYLAAELEEDRIERRVKNGKNDRGDVSGVKTIRGARVVIEVKDRARLDLAGWVREAEIEAGNDGAAVFMVWHKKVGKGHPADWYVTMPGHVAAALLQGGPSEVLA